MKANDILSKASGHLSDRAVTYDNPGGERSMAKTVAAFNAIYDLGMTEVQGWQFMELLKMVRSSQGNFKSDNFEDGAAYAALAGEAAYSSNSGLISNKIDVGMSAEELNNYLRSAYRQREDGNFYWYRDRPIEEAIEKANSALKAARGEK